MHPLSYRNGLKSKVKMLRIFFIRILSNFFFKVSETVFRIPLIFFLESHYKVIYTRLKCLRNIYFMINELYASYVHSSHAVVCKSAFCTHLCKTVHTSPEGGVRKKECYMPFDTIFQNYSPRENILGCFGKIVWDIFTQLQKIQVDFQKRRPYAI